MYLPLGWCASSARVVCISRLEVCIFHGKPFRGVPPTINPYTATKWKQPYTFIDYNYIWSNTVIIQLFFKIDTRKLCITIFPKTFPKTHKVMGNYTFSTNSKIVECSYSPL